MAPTGILEVSSNSRLSHLEDEQVVEIAKAGSSQATEHLIRKYRSFVEYKARSFFLAGQEQDDVVQEGMIGLYKAIRDYRAGKLTHFRSFVDVCVTRQIITAVKSATRNKHIPLNEYTSLQRSYGESDNNCLLDVVADPKNVDPVQILLERHVAQRMWACAVEDLSELEHKVLHGYLAGESYQDMSDSIGCSIKAIDNALQRAKRKVGHRLCEFN